jgi:hypothetical protein
MMHICDPLDEARRMIPNMTYFGRKKIRHFLTLGFTGFMLTKDCKVKKTAIFGLFGQIKKLYPHYLTRGIDFSHQIWPIVAAVYLYRILFQVGGLGAPTSPIDLPGYFI